ncbi:MAG: hypothetical protein MUE59_06210 [Thiobacillaceae bacterium]|jgi:hypothetical protein|nr:hypothetical protein [Thiobacillaceae bacterium]
MSNEIMAGLVEAFSEPQDEPQDEPVGEDILEAETAAEDAPEAESEAEEEPAEAADEEPEAEEPKGRKTLPLVGPDGKTRQVPIDKILADTMHDVVIDGERQFVSYKELVDGYQRQADYTRKTMEVAKARADMAPFAQMVAHAKTDPDFVRHIQSYFQRGPQPELQAAARMDMADEQIAQLLESSDRADTERAKEILRARSQLRNALAQRQQVEQRARAEQQQLLSAYLDVEREKVSVAIPDYPKQAPAIATALQEYYGFSAEELKGVYDSRLVRVAHDAMLYRKSLEEGSKLGLEGKRKPLPPPRAVKPGAGKATSTQEIRRAKELTSRAIKSGRTDDWAAAIASRLGL